MNLSGLKMADPSPGNGKGLAASERMDTLGGDPEGRAVAAEAHDTASGAVQSEWSQTVRVPRPWKYVKSSA